MSTQQPTTTVSAAARLEAQTRRHAELSRRLSTLVGQRDAELRGLEELREEIRKEFNVSDLDSLRSLLETSLRQNDEIVAEFTATLDSVERGVAELEALLKG